MKQTRVRLYVEHPLGPGQSVPVSQAQAHYLFSVMRLNTGDVLAIFNGRDGEYAAQVEAANKRRGQLTCLTQTKPHTIPPDLWLLFAPIKKTRTDFIVEKAVEMGARRILPVRSDFTNSDRIRRDRLQAHATEAAEQCGATYVPDLAELMRLDDLLANWPQNRKIMFCDETLTDTKTSTINRIAEIGGAEWAILIGPEGGFSAAERARLAALPQAHAIGLGPRILRADTAAIAALTLWQTTLGDWP